MTDEKKELARKEIEEYKQWLLKIDEDGDKVKAMISAIVQTESQGYLLRDQVSVLHNLFVFAIRQVKGYTNTVKFSIDIFCNWLNYAMGKKRTVNKEHIVATFQRLESLGFIKRIHEQGEWITFLFVVKESYSNYDGKVQYEFIPSYIANP